MKQLLFEVCAPVSASGEQVVALFDNDWLLRQVMVQQETERTGTAPTGTAPGNPERPADHHDYVGVDRSPGMFGIQGHWWYRGEWSVEESAGSARIVYRVFNIARSHRWAVPLANKMFIGYRNTMQEGIDELAQRIDRKLRGAPTL